MLPALDVKAITMRAWLRISRYKKSQAFAMTKAQQRPCMQEDHEASAAATELQIT